jgi:hypothetical protein
MPRALRAMTRESWRCHLLLEVERTPIAATAVAVTIHYPLFCYKSAALADRRHDTPPVQVSRNGGLV